jgi:hypothetical protein
VARSWAAFCFAARSAASFTLICSAVTRLKSPSSCPRPPLVQEVMERSRAPNSQRSGHTPSPPRRPAHAKVNCEDTAPHRPRNK